MSQNDLFLNLLRPAVLHILRATGFHYGKPSAVKPSSTSQRDT